MYLIEFQVCKSCNRGFKIALLSPEKEILLDCNAKPTALQCKAIQCYQYYTKNTNLLQNVSMKNEGILFIHKCFIHVR